MKHSELEWFAEYYRKKASLFREGVFKYKFETSIMKSLSVTIDKGLAEYNGAIFLILQRILDEGIEENDESSLMVKSGESEEEA
jgi:hypothetical protein